MPKRNIFFSFDYDKDVFRVQQIRNIGAINGETIITANKWEEVKNKSADSIRKWIDENMAGKSAVVVLIGEKTSESHWVDYEIRKGWNEGKGVFGIYIHNLNCPRNGKSLKGKNPFDGITLKNEKKLSSYVACYDPKSWDAYNDIKDNIESWIEKAIKDRE